MALPDYAQDFSRKRIRAAVLLVASHQLLPCADLPQDGAKGPDVCLCATRLHPHKCHVKLGALCAGQQTQYCLGPGDS